MDKKEELELAIQQMIGFDKIHNIASRISTITCFNVEDIQRTLSETNKCKLVEKYDFEEEIMSDVTGMAWEFLNNTGDLMYDYVQYVLGCQDYIELEIDGINYYYGYL